MVRILLLWILPALCFAQVKLDKNLENEYTVPTKERHGHRYMIEIDNWKKDNKDVFGYAAIGIYKYHVDRYSYFEFKGATKDNLDEQATFHPFTGVGMNNPDEYDLIHTDFKDIVRVDLEKYHKDKSNCADPIANGLNLDKKEGNYAMIFIDDDKNGKRVRRIGTWFREFEFFKYADDNNEMKEIDDMNAIMDGINDNIPATRFELLCRVPHDYSKLN